MPMDLAESGKKQSGIQICGKQATVQVLSI
jgi:hypothetical protein